MADDTSRWTPDWSRERQPHSRSQICHRRQQRQRRGRQIHGLRQSRCRHGLNRRQGRPARRGHLWSEHSHDDGREQTPGTERRQDRSSRKSRGQTYFHGIFRPGRHRRGLARSDGPYRHSTTLPRRAVGRTGLLADRSAARHRRRAAHS